MKRSIVLLFAFSSIAFSCNSDAKKTSTEKEVYEKTKESLLEKEEKNW